MKRLRDQATEHFIAGDFESLHKALDSLVSQNDPWGLHYLAGAFSQGIGVATDLAAANRLYLRAAELGFADSQAILGNNLCAGIGCEVDIIAGIALLEKSSKQGHAYADFFLSRIYINGINVTKNVELGLKYLERSAFNGCSEAQRHLGCFKLVGEIIDTNVNEGLALLKRAIDQSNIDAMYDLGKMYEAGEHLEKNHSLAAKYLLMAAENDHVKAMHDLGAMYFNGTGVPRDVAIANKWYLSAANRGSYLSSYCLGLNAESGENTLGHASIPLAIVWYLIANAQCEGGANESLNRIANLKKQLSTPDIEMVIRFVTAFANERQFPWAQLALGDMYLTGQFVTADAEAAYKYFALAASGGLEAANRRLLSQERAGNQP